jgi:hypothetical protein
MNIVQKISKMSTGTKLLLVVILFFILAGLMLCGRLLWFHRWIYLSPGIAEIEASPVATASYRPGEDKPIRGDGHIVIDLSHNNNLQVNDLAPLRDRLKARGVTVETFDGGDESLGACLHEASALVIIAPGKRYTASEREVIVAFVEDGGLLLLAADPTRPVPEGDVNDPFRSPYDALFPTSAVPAINSVANAFGVVYFDDYLYNLEDNVGSYRNVRFAPFGKSGLTKGVETVVFFVAHSLRSDGTSLIIGDEHTQSPVRSGETDLAAAVLTTDERVLALGDITFMTSPYHTIADNDQFLSNIADWLAIDKRQRDELDDFPYLFKRPVDLVQASGDTLDPQLIVHASDWQASFERLGLTLNLRAEADPSHDTILVATYEDTKAVEDYLDSAGITVTVTIADEDEDRGAEKDKKTEEEKEPTDFIEIEKLGTVAIEGTTLFVVDYSDERVVIVVLAEDMEKAIDAIDRLADYDFSGCVQADEVTICSTGEAPKKPEKEEPTKEEEEKPAAASILIIASDDKPEGARTGAPEFEAILKESYDVTVWYTSRDGIPTASDTAGYDAYIIDSGDYAADLTDVEILAALEEAEGVGAMLIGAQPLPFFVEFAPINDIQVADATHPLAAGFESDEVLALSASESGVPAVVVAEDESELGEDTAVVFRRGPDSPSPGTAIVVAAYDKETDVRMILAFFSFYQLPEDAQRTFALNAAAWLTRAEE